IDWWDMTMPTRGASRKVSHVGVMQRLTVDDFSAHVLKEGDFRHVMLPMRFEKGWQMPESRFALNPGAPGERAVLWKDWRTTDGELLAPGQFPEEVVQALERRRL